MFIWPWFAQCAIQVDIDGAGAINYTITSPASGVWPLSNLASLLEVELPAGALCGIGKEGKIRITSLLGGNQSTIDITAGIGGTNLLTLLIGADTAIDGTYGYTTCLTDEVDGSIYTGGPITAYGIPDVPDAETQEAKYNYKSKITAKYNETLYISDNYYKGAII